MKKLSSKTTVELTQRLLVASKTLIAGSSTDNCLLETELKHFTKSLKTEQIHLKKCLETASSRDTCLEDSVTLAECKKSEPVI